MIPGTYMAYIFKICENGVHWYEHLAELQYLRTKTREPAAPIEKKCYSSSSLHMYMFMSRTTGKESKSCCSFSTCGTCSQYVTAAV